MDLSAAEMGKGIPVYDLLRRAGLASSGGEAKRLIRGGGAKLNDRKMTDENELVTPAQFQDGKIKLSAGKKKHAVVKLV
jgi:Tyrosyl-tRNA synthetase